MTKPAIFYPVLFIALTLLLLTTACVPQTAIPVFVTPTPQTPPTTSSTPAPATETPPPTTPTTPAPTPTIGTVGPTVTFIGPVIGPQYTLPPTSTPRPSVTPAASDTPTAGPSPTPTATTTPRGPLPTSLPTLDRAQIGIQVHAMQMERQDWNEIMNQLSEERLNVGWVKIQLSWALMQPNTRDEIGVEFRQIEQYIEEINQQREINVLISIAKAPAWARTTDVEDGPPDDPDELARFIRLVLQEFGQAIDAVEIWNEPNLLREWRGVLPFNGASYMELFEPSYRAIREYSSSITVVTAGLAPTTNTSGSRDDREFLREMYANGLGTYSDVAIGVHPYSWGNPPDARCCNSVDGQAWDDDPHFFFADTLDEYRAIMNRNGHENNSLWVTEFGWATWEGYPGDPPEGWIGYNDKWEQANYTLRAFQIGQERDDIGPMFLWNLNFGILPFMVENRDERIAYSLLGPWQPRERPLFWMIYDALRPELELPRYD